MSASALFAGMLALLHIGRRAGLRRIARDPESARVGAGAVEGAVFGLLGLLVAFTFSGAATRFDGRRHLATQEANAIGTAWLRIDLLPPEAQPPLRTLFRRYVDSRLETYRKLPDVVAAKAELARSTELQGEIWRAAVAAALASEKPQIAALLLPALNEMIDVTTDRLMATRIHPPVIIPVLLGVLALCGALLAGYGMASRGGASWVHDVLFAAVMAITVYVTVDIEYPRLGMIRVDAADHVIAELRQTMD